MNFVGLAGLIVAFFLIFFGIAYDQNIGLNFTALSYFLDYSSVFIVILGSFATVFIAFPLIQIKNALKSLKYVFGNVSVNLIETLMTINDISKLARKNILGLEDALPGIENPMLRGGLRMVVDRVDKSFINKVLITESRKMIGGVNDMIGVFRFLATISPAFGMMGTLIGLINLLQNLNDSSKIGPAMSIALITTFYGSVMANIVFTPIANKIVTHRNALLSLNNMVMDGIVLIEKTERPEHIEQALLGYFPDHERIKYDNYKYGGG